MKPESDVSGSDEIKTCDDENMNVEADEECKVRERRCCLTEKCHIKTLNHKPPDAPTGAFRAGEILLRCLEWSVSQIAIEKP